MECPGIQSSRRYLGAIVKAPFATLDSALRPSAQNNYNVYKALKVNNQSQNVPDNYSLSLTEVFSGNYGVLNTIFGAKSNSSLNFC